MSQLTSSKVLIVEDDRVCQDAFQTVFAQLPGDWQMQAVPDGAQALEVLAHSPQGLDLVLVDIGLPDMLGTVVIAAARQRFDKVPILVISSFQSERAFLDAVSAGANGYLLKNESALSLAHSIELVLQGQYPVSPAMARYLFKLAESKVPASAPKQALAQVPDLSKISAREWELLQLISQGHSYARCAELMHVALSTVQSHVRNTYRKLGVNNHRQAMNKVLATHTEKS